MRSLQLQAALTAYIEAVSEHLSAQLAAGAEIPFELEQQPHRRGSAGPSLYCYRPLTAEFLAERRMALEALPEHEQAASLLGEFEGLDRYLVGVGEDIARLSRAARVRTAIGFLLGDVFAEQSDFELRPERVKAATERLQSTSLATTARVTIVATLQGLTITSPELPLTGGLTIARPASLDGLPAAVQETGEDGHEHLVVALATEEEDPREALARGQEVLRDLLRALRLFGDGRVTLGALAWARIGGGQWTPLPLGGGGRPHGMLIVTAEQEDELRAFCNLVSRRAPHGNELAWALRRFELGCEREDPFEALSDNLLALRALLEPEGPASGMLAGRLAALCATPERRLSLTERTVQALALERSVIAGHRDLSHRRRRTRRGPLRSPARAAARCDLRAPRPRPGRTRRRAAAGRRSTRRRADRRVLQRTDRGAARRSGARADGRAGVRAAAARRSERGRRDPGPLHLGGRPPIGVAAAEYRR